MGGWGGSRKFGWDEWPRFWKPLPYFRQPRTQALRKGSRGRLKTRKKLFEPSPVPLGANRREFGPPHDPLRSVWVRTRHYQSDQNTACDFLYPISDLTQNSIPYFRPFENSEDNQIVLLRGRKLIDGTIVYFLEPYRISDQSAHTSTQFETKKAQKPYPLRTHIPALWFI